MVAARNTISLQTFTKIISGNRTRKQKANIKFAIILYLCRKNMKQDCRKASLIGICRLRPGTDGHGITTLVAFHGCPLRCKYCLNPECHNPDAKVKRMTPEEVMKELNRDELYYIATKGGVTFGGGEPLLQSLYIKEILDLGAKRWNVTIETSLNVSRIHLERLLPHFDEYIVDIKDMNPTIYESYTGKSNELVKSNLKWLVENGMGNRVICRIPLIPHYNTAIDQQNSQKELADMGITRFDLFTYYKNIV